MSVGGVVGAVVGGVIGAYLGGNVYQGAAIGYSLGAGAQALLAPPRTYGPRLEDLRNQTSSYDVDIPERWGAGRQAGNVIWQTDLIQNTIEHSSKGGQSSTTYKYTFHTAIGVCQGPILGISRIWANKKVLYDARPTNTGPLSDPKIGNVRIYLGDETQEADPLIASISGPNTPAYRGLAYVVLEDVDGTDTQGRIQWEFEVIADGSAAVHYANVCALTASDPGDVYSRGRAWIGGPQGQTIHWLRDGGEFRCLDGGAIEFLGPSTELVPVNTTDWPCFAIEYTRNNPLIDFGATHQIVDVIFPNNEHARRTVCNNIVLSGDTSLGGPGNLFAYDQESDVTVIGNNQSDFRYFARTVYLTSGGTPILAGTPPQIIAFDEQVLGTHSLVYGERMCALAAAAGRVFFMLFDGTNFRLRILSQTNGSLINDFIGPLGQIGHRGADGQESIVTDGTTVWAYCMFGDGGYVWRWNADGSYRVLATGIGTLTDGGVVTDGLGGNRIFIDDDSLVQQWYSQTTAFVGRIQRAVFASPTASTVPLGTIVSDICAEAGLASSDIDVTQLTDLVSGYTRPRNMTARAAIEPLQQCYYFDAVESDFKLKFVKRGGGIVATIPYNDRAAHEDGQDMPDHLKIVRANELEVPSLVDVEYVDASADYLIGSQYERRLTKKVVSASDLKLPINLTADQAKRVAAASLYSSWLTQTYSFSTSRKYAHLEPTDVVSLPTENATYVARITRKTERASGVIDWEAAQEDAAVYSQTGSGTPLSYLPTTLRTISRTDLDLLDIPILQDADNDGGAYAKATPANVTVWPGASIARIDNGTPTVLGVVQTPSVVGVALNALADYSGILAFDEGNYLDVHVNVGTLASVTQQQALAGQNAFLVGHGVAGQEEIIVARDVALIAPKEYRLTGLLRGIKSTPTNLHAVADRVVKLDTPGMVRIPGSSFDVGLTKRYGAVTFGRTIDGSDEQDFKNTARGLWPLPPIHVGGGRTGADMVLRWQRRTRLAAPFRDRIDAPLGESSEQYLIEISQYANFSFVARRYTTSAQTITYDGATQVLDGTNGVTLYSRISQLSTSIGPGTPATISVAP